MDGAPRARGARGQRAPACSRCASCSSRWAASRCPAPSSRRPWRRRWPPGRSAPPSSSADLASGARRGTVALGEQGHGEPLDTVRTRARRKGGPMGGHRREADGRRRPHARTGPSWWPAVRRACAPTCSSRPAATWSPRSTRRASWPGWCSTTPRSSPLGPSGNQAALWRRVQDDIAVGLAAETVGRRRPGAHRGDRLHVRADRLRQAGRHLPDRAPPAGRDVPAGRDGPRRVPVRRLGLGHRVARARAGGRHGGELRRRGRRAGDGRRHPAARRRRLHLGQRRPLPLQAGEAERHPLRRRGRAAPPVWPSLFIESA